MQLNMKLAIQQIIHLEFIAYIQLYIYHVANSNGLTCYKYPYKHSCGYNMLFITVTMPVMFIASFSETEAKIKTIAQL